jgi:WD40 repeat protein
VCPPVLRGEDKAEAAPWEYRTARFGTNETENTRKLNELAQDGWEYVGPLGNGSVAFRRPLRLTGTLLRRIDWPDIHVFHTTISPDGRYYLGGGDAGTLRIWEVSSGRQVQELPVWFGLFTPDGKQVLGHKGEKTVFLYDVESGKEVRTWEAPEPIASMALSRDGKQVVTGLGDKSLRVWDVATGKELRKLEGHDAPPSAAFSPDGKRIVSASNDKTVRLWDAATGKLERTWDDFKDVAPLDGHDLILQAFFVGDGSQVAGYVWAQEKALVVWDAAGGGKLRRLDLGADHHKDAALSADGRLLLTGHEDRTVRLRDLATGRELLRLDMADINVPRGVSFSADGRYAAAGSHRGWVYLWQLRK